MSTALQKSIARLGQRLDDNKKDASPLKIALDKLVPYAHQSRTSMDQDALNELARTISEVGVIEPLLVRPLDGDRFEIIAGERRWRAARIAGLTEVPTLVRALDDATTDKIHLYENIHRENLSNLDLAQRIAQDLASAKGDLGAVASKYGKSKSWVSKLSTIAQGGEVMAALVEEGVTADRAVLAGVASLERKAPALAKQLGAQLKQAPTAANKRAIVESFAKAGKGAQAAKTKAPRPGKNGAQDESRVEPAWRFKGGVVRDLGLALVAVDLSPLSEFSGEFAQMVRKHGNARLANEVRHPNAVYAIVEFGGTGLHRRAYRADELRLLSVT